MIGTCFDIRTIREIVGEIMEHSTRIQQYKKLMTELLNLRKLSGLLDDETESAFIEEMDYIWARMSRRDREEAERFTLDKMAFDSNEKLQQDNL